MCTAYCLSPVVKLYKLCFLISPSALLWGGGYSSFGITFPPPMCFPSFEIFWSLVLFGRGKGDNLKFSVSLVSFCTLFSIVSLIPFSCLFCRCVGLGYAAGQISQQSSIMPAESGKRFKPSKYVPVSAAAIFLVGATTLFFAFTWVFSCWYSLGGTPWHVRGVFFSLEFSQLLAKPSDWECLMSDTGEYKSQRHGEKSEKKPILSALLQILLHWILHFALLSFLWNHKCLLIFLPSSIIKWSWSRKEVGGNHQGCLKQLKQSVLWEKEN